MLIISAGTRSKRDKSWIDLGSSARKQDGEKPGDGIDTTMLRFNAATNGSISLGRTPSDLVAKSVSEEAAGDDVTIVAAES